MSKFELNVPIPEKTRLILRDNLTGEERLLCLRDGRTAATIHSLFSRMGNVTVKNINTVEALKVLAVQNMKNKIRVLEYNLKQLNSL